MFCEIVLGEQCRPMNVYRTCAMDRRLDVFDDETHGFVKKENQIKGYAWILRFLE